MSEGSSGSSPRAAILRGFVASFSAARRHRGGSTAREPGSRRSQGHVAERELAYRRYSQIFSDERWKALEAKGASTRCLWASTSTKNPVLGREVRHS
jgi:transaldolase